MEPQRICRLLPRRVSIGFLPNEGTYRDANEDCSNRRRAAINGTTSKNLCRLLPRRVPTGFLPNEGTYRDANEDCSENGNNQNDCVVQNGRILERSLEAQTLCATPLKPIQPR